MDETSIARFQREIAAMGYKFQFGSLAGFHNLNLGMFDLARKFRSTTAMAGSTEVHQFTPRRELSAAE